jgi:outer membrane biosynthesis protein TonB
MSKTTLKAGTSPFAHLLALVTGNPVSGKKAEEEAPDETGAETEEEEEEASTAEEEAPEEEAAAEEEEDKPEGKRARRAKKAETDDDEAAESRAESDEDDEEMAQARREGFEAAQARGRRIFSAASAGLRPDMAAHLAFNDTRSSASAIEMLDMAASGAAPQAPRAGSRLAERMARVVLPKPGVGTAGKKPEDMSFGEMALAAGKKAGIF